PLLFALGTASLTMVGNNVGAGQMRRARHIAWIAALISAGATGLHRTRRCTGLVFGAAVSIWIVNLLAAALRGAGNVRIPAILTAVGAAMTLCLSPLLIFGWGPFPRFGVAGAGLAMIVYYVIATVALIAYLASPHTPIRLLPT